MRHDIRILESGFSRAVPPAESADRRVRGRPRREIGNEVLEVRGQAVEATRFKLTAYEIDLTLWYSSDDEWLALESVAKGGHIIRYELS